VNCAGTWITWCLNLDMDCALDALDRPVDEFLRIVGALEGEE
jgi:hypothetical protein